jgi:hypothetical protein
VEGRERRAVCDDGLKMIVPLVQPPKTVENEVAIRDGAAEVGQGVGHALHLATVVAHRGIALNEVAERGVEVKRTCFTVADELVLDCVPEFPRSDVVLLADVLKLVGDCAEDPGEDDGLHAIPGRVIDRRSVEEDMVEEDMVGELVALQGEQNQIMPACVACRRRIQNSRDKRANVLYPAGLRVEHGDDGGVTLGGWEWRRARGGGGGRRQLQGSCRGLDL